ncbi:MAG: hypothetical protein KAX25_00510 [Dehalococcoidia bacterium]|nr:hypothetical protein [Dehalococcoidia bacterium]
MISKDYIVEKIKALPDDKLKEIADFMEFVESKGRKTELAESDMGDYLGGLCAYEEMLAAGEIKWK